MRLALTAKDCERLGCPETMEIDLSTVTNREAVLLQQMGFSVLSLGRRLQIKQLDDGDTEMDYAAWDVLVWLALRRAGIEVDVHTFEYDIHGLRLRDEEQPAPLPDASGKAEAPAASPKKTSTSTRTSRRRSTSTG